MGWELDLYARLTYFARVYLKDCGGCKVNVVWKVIQYDKVRAGNSGYYRYSVSAPYPLNLDLIPGG